MNLPKQPIIFLSLLIALGCSNSTDTSSTTSSPASDGSTKTSSAGITSSDNGEVIWVGKGCDYIVLEAGPWYVLAQTYTGIFSTGDKIQGQLNSFGFKDCRKNESSDVRLYIENYWGNKDRCFEWLKQHNKCGL